MIISFSKYHGNGNDFIIIDGRDNAFQFEPEVVRRLCDRHYGIGADGLMILKTSEMYHFKMLYYNSDGNLASMCGNGGRCISAFAFLKGIAPQKIIFDAFDGIHEAVVENDLRERNEMYVSLKMSDVKSVEKNETYYFLDTGSPHYVEFVEKVAEIDVVKEGRKTRQSERFLPGGTNVSFVEISEGRIFVRTYERGVEDETLSCGTGVTASALATFLESGKKDFRIHTTGGDFTVSFETDGKHFTNIWLHGPAKLVFVGNIFIEKL